ncbi:hypothetical protein [Paenibacillus sp. D51F]
MSHMPLLDRFAQRLHSLDRRDDEHGLQRLADLRSRKPVITMASGGFLPQLHE